MVGLVLLSELINDEMRLLMWQVQLVCMLDSIYVVVIVVVVERRDPDENML